MVERKSSNWYGSPLCCYYSFSRLNCRIVPALCHHLCYLFYWFPFATILTSCPLYKKNYVRAKSQQTIATEDLYKYSICYSICWRSPLVLFSDLSPSLFSPCLLVSIEQPWNLNLCRLYSVLYAGSFLRVSISLHSFHLVELATSIDNIHSYQIGNVETNSCNSDIGNLRIHRVRTLNATHTYV